MVEPYESRHTGASETEKQPDLETYEVIEPKTCLNSLPLAHDSSAKCSSRVGRPPARGADSRPGARCYFTCRRALRTSEADSYNRVNLITTSPAIAMSAPMNRIGNNRTSARVSARTDRFMC
jgi:hypothetical protein